MGEPDFARVDVAAVLDAARQYDNAADMLDAVIRNHLSGLRFDGAVAGRMHAAGGDAVRVSVAEVVDRLRQWARASAEIAAELRSSADRYVEVDARGAQRIG
ncbi:ESX-1 secretion-associated protein [Mycolicibacterium moriokaense]|nr:ESX-1 secretion-associated protein [Mycolicibacterium moriokaense]